MPLDKRCVIRLSKIIVMCRFETFDFNYAKLLITFPSYNTTYYSRTVSPLQFEIRYDYYGSERHCAIDIRGDGSVIFP